MGWKITDKFLVDPQDNDSVPFDQGGIVRRSTWAKIKDYILGTASLATIDKTVRGAINEVNTSLSEKVNPNLLINGAPSVWQRGTSFNNVQQYTADRWFYVCYTSSPQGSLTKDVDNSIKITNFNTNQNFIEQIIETNLSEKLAGRKVTLSAEIKVTGMTQGSLFLQLLSSLGTDSINYTGAVMDKLIINQSDISSDYKKFTLTATLPNTLKTLVPQIGSANSIGSGMVNSNCIVNIRNIKLELGSLATPFVPRLYAEELALCKRYYQSGTLAGLPIFFNTDAIYYQIPLSCPMRIQPSIVNPNNNLIALYNNNNSQQSGFSYVIGQTNQSTQTIIAQKTAHGLTSGGYLTFLNSAGLDSEIY
ncbi:hypothetical protein OD350_00060 [Clostridium beijerinckii]|uniref:hypothetical protein n=1 Tax=Clostridium beijerinckii TaxID=1520 RepID=UPI001570E558|nr:hypothetical protein [Clostridium beijerinckii]NRT33262.1 hypothetical protein [Clostridium beijerinckii]NRT47312.1 hypothetical protein [Clostridium beijerinckii]NRZ18683.1 hypothetical protein [Clostridium beijerinckii]UYZ36081.1 hypothetical protein OD350_00060 [Clostridium beijerinckii]